MQELDHKSKEVGAVYLIAGLKLAIIYPVELSREVLLPTFEPFLVQDDLDLPVVCRIKLSFDAAPDREESIRLLSDQSPVWGDRFRFYEEHDRYRTTVQNENVAGEWIMLSSKDFEDSTLYISPNRVGFSDVISWFAMVCFGQNALLHQAVLIHASTVVQAGKAYAFLGQSGTGKSTHSRQWIKNIEGTELLNDDNPAVRVQEGGKVYIYGTPWSGKTPCYKNKKAILQAFVRLKQGGQNNFRSKEGIEAFLCLLPSCSALRWNKGLFVRMNSTVEYLVQKVRVGELTCLPNKEAALLCYLETNK